MNIRPLADRIVIIPSTAEQKTAGGIVLPDTAQDKPQQGKVVAVGPGKFGKDGECHSLDIEVDDMVLYIKQAGTKVKLDGIEYLILAEQEVLAVSKGE